MKNNPEHSLIHKSSEFRTICEVHREIYDLVITIDNEEIKFILKEKVLEAFIMAKKNGQET